ncbi:peptidyl-prolyl cis-trans isomerase [Edwardsiella piscicida]|nr:peptidyl-prolyl cis-trans isomerase [Edwardsiella piscicida]
MPALLILINLDPGNTIKDHAAGKILHEQDITAAAQNQNRLSARRRSLPMGQKRCATVRSKDLLGPSRKTEGGKFGK